LSESSLRDEVMVEENSFSGIEARSSVVDEVVYTLHHGLRATSGILRRACVVSESHLSMSS
jgi:hypothetical protein